MELTKGYIRNTLSNEDLFKKGEHDSFSFNGWSLTLTRTDEDYQGLDMPLPFKFSVTGTNENGSTWSRLYVNLESAFLHILNHFNENAQVADRYRSLEEALNDARAEIS